LSNGLITRAEAGEGLEALATEIGKGAEVSETTMIRAARTPGLGAQVLVNLFDARVGQTVRGTADNGLDRIIGQILTITPNADVLTGSVAETLRSQSVEGINSDIQAAYHAAILKENPVRLMTENIERTLGLNQ